MAPGSDRTTRIPPGVASPLMTNDAAKGSVFVNVRSAGNLSNWLSAVQEGNPKQLAKELKACLKREEHYCKSVHPPLYTLYPAPYTTNPKHQTLHPKGCGVRELGEGDRGCHEQLAVAVVPNPKPQMPNPKQRESEPERVSGRDKVEGVCGAPGTG